MVSISDVEDKNTIDKWDHKTIQLSAYPSEISCQ